MILKPFIGRKQELKKLQALHRKAVASLVVVRGYATVPILFHIGGVAASVEADGYFYRIIDSADFLCSTSSN